MDPLVRGRLFHRALFHLFQEGGDVGDILQRLAAAAESEHAPAIHGVWRREVQKLETDLRGWLTGRDERWSPLHTELAFDPDMRDECDPSSIPEPIILEGGYKLRGVIDLVERHSDGRLRVVDHKTGRAPEKEKTPECTGFGEVLQPMLYALAAESMLAQTPCEALLSYATLRENYAEVRIPIHLESRTRIAHVLETIDRWIDRGFLPAAPRPDACTGCEYRPVCGPYEEMRLREKSEPELHDLLEIRSRP
jgi:CRISPR/Cas system-associated exonuclease Cas4 (RecB family)